MLAIEEARRVLRIEAQSIINSIENLDENFVKACELVYACKGKVIVTGIGKSGLVGRKISSTLSSTGTPSLFLHPAESSHGDLGVISRDDVVIAISYSGDSQELSSIVSFTHRKSIPLIAFTSRADSSLGTSGVYIDIGVKEEACPLGLAPTSSTIVTMALGDALAMAVLRKRGFQREDFAEFHPSGRLGRKLLTRVKDLMHSGEGMPIVSEDSPMSEVLSLMTSKEVRGVAGVVDSSGALLGIITDGDVRRRLEKNNQAFTENAKELMNRSPKTIDGEEFAEKALFVMEQFQIQSLFVIDRSSEHPRKPIGLIHLQDLLKANVR